MSDDQPRMTVEEVIEKMKELRDWLEANQDHPRYGSLKYQYDKLLAKFKGKG